MTTLLICNIGNSDLKVGTTRMHRPRSEGEQLWATFEQHAFELPIIEPCLRYLIDEQGDIDQLMMFYTDQPAKPETLALDRFGVSLRDKDTLWYAQIAERLVRERFSDRVKTMTRVRVERGNGKIINPSLYDEAFDAYGDLITRTYIPEVTACYVLMAGGIPACNVALQLQSLSAYGERCRFIYQPEGGTPYELRVSDQMQATFRRATALNALKQRDFATALRNVEALDQRQIDPALLPLLKYAHYRESFDFVRARQALADGLRAASGELRGFLNALKPDLDRLVDRADSAALLVEIYASAGITFGNARYADFLGRVFRFQEAALRYILESRMDMPTDMSPKAKPINLPRYLVLIEANSELKAYLEAAKIDGKPLRYTDGPNRPVMSAMLDFIVKGGKRADGQPYLKKDDQGRFAGLKKAMGQLDKLAELRNQSIIAHGYAGVSREELDRVYGGDAQQMLADMGKVLEMLGLGRVVSPFDRIADQAAEVLRHAGA
jgi:hypothetical protein